MIPEVWLMIQKWPGDCFFILTLYNYPTCLLSNMLGVTRKDVEMTEDHVAR